MLPRCFPKREWGSTARKNADEYDATRHESGEVDLPAVQMGLARAVALALVIFGVWLISAWIK
jgi:hypothetical protein